MFEKEAIRARWMGIDNLVILLKIILRVEKSIDIFDVHLSIFDLKACFINVMVRALLVFGIRISIGLLAIFRNEIISLVDFELEFFYS
jgi:hypothetical protein